MKMDWVAVFKQLVVNAVFWVGAFALGMAVLAPGEQIPYAELFAVFLAFNLVLLFLLNTFAPRLFEQVPGAVEDKPGQLGFRLYPLAYPKVWVDDLRDYAPELIHVDISDGKNMLFGANVTRDALQQFRDSLNQVLNLKEAGPVAKQQRQKKAKTTAQG